MTGELIAGKKNAEAMKAGWGVFLGVITALILKILVSGIMAFYFIKAIF